MKILNRTRQLYKRIVEGKQKTENDFLRDIERARHLQNLTKHPGWKMVEEFMETQRKGTQAFMEQETSKSINVVGLAFVFNTFIKWLFASLEGRAYNKIKTYIEVSIQNGEKSRQKLAKLQESKK